MGVDHPFDTRAPVAVVGGGPVGLSLALGLARQGVRSTLLERNTATSEHSKSAGIHVRTREAFRQWGIEERVLEAGHLVRRLTQHSARDGKHLLSFDFSELDAEADRPGVLMLEQGKTEGLLLEAVRESGMCDVRFGSEVVGLTPGGDGAEVRVREGGGERTLSASFVVGCDGASSFVRGALGLPFEGITYSLWPLLADVRVDDERDALPWPRLWNGPGGVTAALRLRPGLWRIIRIEVAEPRDEATDREVNLSVDRVLGEGPVEVAWASRFRIHRRSSPRFRVGRVLLAGDAAHVHSPVGGLGMNAGVQDAHNLAWKLAHALRGGDTDRLLDSYDAERRAVVAESVSRYTDLLTRAFLQTPSVVRAGALTLLRSALRIGRLRKKMLRTMAMIDLDYPASLLLDRTERAAGVRLPNPALRSPGGEEVRLYDLLPAVPIMLDVAEHREFASRLPVERVIRVGPGAYRDPSGALRGLLGDEDGWILVRPDVHAAWARHSLDGAGGAVRQALGMPRR